jgi:hypothetical protein
MHVRKQVRTAKVTGITLRTLTTHSIAKLFGLDILLEGSSSRQCVRPAPVLQSLVVIATLLLT